MKSTTSESDLAMSPVMEASRMSPVALTAAWWSNASPMFWPFIAAALAQAYGTRNALIGMGAAVVFYGLAGGILARYAIRTGLGCFLFSHVLFGSIGAPVATLIFFATAIYYAMFEGAVLAVTASKIIPGVSYAWASVVIVLYSVPLIAGSVQRWLNKFNGVLFPVYIGGLALAVSLCLMKYGYSTAWLRLGPATGNSEWGWWNCFVAYLGASIFFMFSQDFARFGRLRDSRYHGLVNFGYVFYAITFMLNGVVGIFLVGMTQLSHLTEASVVDAFVAVLGGSMALGFVWVTQTRINTANYYVSTVNMQAFFESLFPLRLRKFTWAVIVGVIVLALMLVGNALKYMLVALSYQGVFVTAWAGVALSHVLLVPASTVAGVGSGQQGAAWPKVNVAGLSGWLSGAAFGLVLMKQEGLLHTLSTPGTLIVSAIMYALLRRREPTLERQIA